MMAGLKVNGIDQGWHNLWASTGALGISGALSCLITPMSSSIKKEEEIVQTHFEIDMEPVLALDFYIKYILRTISRTIIFETY
ncbi:hypothetical protein P8452_61595 [Trifolium repens]|nr:hypothetical protein P8452_61595 [Trifolium repens]